MPQKKIQKTNLKKQMKNCLLAGNFLFSAFYWAVYFSAEKYGN
jgi:hypothetical protein